MLFKKKEEYPKEIGDSGLSEWYGRLSDRDRVRVRRYVDGAPSLPAFDMLLHIVRSAIEDENYRFAAEMCPHAAELADTDLRKFETNEESIDALFFAERWEEALELCRKGKEMYRSLEQGGECELPQTFRFRNRTIDILVGYGKDYESAERALEEFHGMGLISDEDLQYRKNGLKVHRLQRTFDSIYSLK